MKVLLWYSYKIHEPFKFFVNMIRDKNYKLHKTIVLIFPKDKLKTKKCLLIAGVNHAYHLIIDNAGNQ